MRTCVRCGGRTLLDVPNDADSLTESDVDDSAATADERGDADVDAEVESPTPAPDPAGDDPEEAAVEPDPDADGSPFGEELRLPDEDGYEGEAVLSDDEDEFDFGDAEFEGDFVLADEYGDGDLLDADGAGYLFDGDPDEFELEVGVGPYPDARPRPGDMLVLDDSAHHPVRPPVRRMSRAERRRRVRLQARRVRRIVRHVEPWSVLKISIFFYACLWVIFLVAGFMIWGVAEGSGTVDKIESLIIDLFALDTFEFNAGQIFRGYALGGLALAIAGTTFNVLMCLLFNLISDLTGGLRITMIEEETARPTPPRRRRRRRPPVRR